MISIVLPVYNGEKYISQAIESVLQQTYKKIELIIVNDGSTDNTENEIMKFKDSRVIYIKQKNQGPSAARNKGMSIAKGKYFAFIDADDLYKPNKIKEQADILDKNKDVYLVYNGYIEVDEDLSVIKEMGAEFVYKERENLLAMMLFRPIITAPPSIMIRRECYEAGFKYDEKYIHGEDYKLFIDLLKQYNFYYIPKSLYIYRKHELNLTNEHKKQIAAEAKVIGAFTDKEILEIVNSSTFNSYNKDLLYAKIFIKRNQYKQALVYLKRCLSVNTASEPWFYLGNCKYIEGDFGLAENSYRRAIEINKKMAEAYNNLGCTYGLTGKTTESEKMFKKALELRPNFMDAQFNLQQIKNKNMKNFKLTTRELRKTLAAYKV